jgi:hypothetical protein
MNALRVVWCPFLFERDENMRKKKKVSEFYRYKFCRKCIWASREGLCPFLRCPKAFGWVADKNKKNVGNKRG